jgi:hypothetical protein
VDEEKKISEQLSVIRKRLGGGWSIVGDGAGEILRSEFVALLDLWPFCGRNCFVCSIDLSRQ